MQLFYLENSESDKIHLNAEESKHLSRVLRKVVGDRIHFSDGNGHEIIAVITDDNQKQCELNIEVRRFVEKNSSNLHLLIAPTKQSERVEWSVEKCTEIGIAEFSSLITARSERSRLKTERLKKIAISAMKQSGQFYLPSINDPIDFTTFIGQSQNLNTQKFIAHCEPDNKRELNDALLVGDAIIIIGPEGDFTPEEIIAAIDAGFVPVSLGPTRLRTETAGIYATTIFQLKNNSK